MIKTLNSKIPLCLALSFPFLWALTLFLPIKSSIRPMDQMLSPSPSHPLGTDVMGRDLFLRLFEAISGAVLPLWGVVVLASFVGIMLSAFFICLRKRKESVFFKGPIGLFEGLLICFGAVPFGILAFFWSYFHDFAGLLPLGEALFLIVFVRCYLSVQYLYLEDSKKEFWLAHKAMGGQLFQRIYSYGLLGSWYSKLIGELVFHLQMAVIVEAAISYLGFGVQEPMASFGNILTSHFAYYLKGDYQVLVFTCLFLMYTCYLPQALLLLKKVYPKKNNQWKVNTLFTF